MPQWKIDLTFINEHIDKTEHRLSRCATDEPTYDRLFLHYKELLSIRDTLIEQQNKLLQIYKEFIPIKDEIDNAAEKLNSNTSEETSVLSQFYSDIASDPVAPMRTVVDGLTTASN